jgi:hypothetical protein
MANREDGTTILNIGKSRSGKTSIIKAVEKLNSRSLAFDPKTEWCELGFALHETKESLFNALVNSEKNTKISFASYDKKDFDYWAACAFNFNREYETLLIAEELGAVTNAGAAVGHWARLINQGLGFGMVLQATVQRGQEVDKTIINNSTAINVFQHATEQDAQSMADRIGVDISEIPRSPMEFIVWTPVHGIIIKKGRVNYKNGVPRFTGIKKGTSRPVNLALQANGMFKGVHYL